MPPQLQTTSHSPPVPSPLSHPVSPFSPLSPLLPLLPTLRSLFSQPHAPAPISSPPPTSNSTPTPDSPLPWLWTCHSCHHSYPLGATRRCLDDGHTFCAGVSSVRRRGKNGVRKEKRWSRACGSEFDYTGWKAWSRWRKARDKSGEGGTTRLSREMEVDIPRHGQPDGGEQRASGQKFPVANQTGAKKKDCWEACTYPSHCRWGKAVGIHTPSPSKATFSFGSFPDTPNAHMADLPALEDGFESPPSPERGEECIDPRLLGAEAELILRLSSFERDHEGCAEDDGSMALDALPTVYDHEVEQGASTSLSELALAPPVSSLYPR
ncbi:hypothetical protein G6514_005690 [Epicoccum nigrum]|nr:hypothetical protein G6514_005690 [Epicoccum nigrum]